MNENEVGRIIIDKALTVLRRIGPGLLESTYEICLSYELIQCGLSVERQKVLPVIYNEGKLDCGYRIDLLVGRSVIIEIKSVDGLNDVHFARVLTYLKLSGLKLGYLINFNVRLLKDGIRGIVNNLDGYFADISLASFAVNFSPG